MFTLEQIKAAHQKVQTGADFPTYIADLIALGVQGYDTIVTDGHVSYYGANNHRAATDKTYELIPIASAVNKERFIEYLVMHQDGQTDYYTFCTDAAKSGIASWRVDIIAMTCTYSDSSNNPIVIEKIAL
tara:strand:- start:973 stop:1362 length:390 start_codon:yes stop_codon:yes gene_type:complete